MNNLSVSILNVENLPEFLNKLQDVKNKLSSIKKIETFNISIHFDVMDNEFVPNTGVELEKMKIVKEYGYDFDAHFMVSRPIEDGYIDKAINYGCRDITIHYEIDNFEKVLNYLCDKKKELEGNLKIGVAIKPKTSIEIIEKFRDKVDKILVMSVEPGFGGQEYIKDTLEKIKSAKEKYKDKFIQVDGGVNATNFNLNIRQGVDSIVAGAYITKDKSKLLDRIITLNIIWNIENLPKEADINFDSKILQTQVGGYAQGDILLGIRVPAIRKLAKMWYNIISRDALQYFISSPIHDYRRFAVFCLTYLVNEKNKNEIKTFIDENIKYINNWDLVDSCVPICIGKQLLSEDDKHIYNTLREYTKSDNIWVKRIGIVSLLYIAKANRKSVVFKVIDDVFFEEFHLYQKATGWVLRELYKVNPKDTLDYLLKKKKVGKVPSILKSYACEKMSIEEKNILK